MKSGLPSDAEKAIVELKSKTRDALGVRKVRIETARPELHAASGEDFNLFALRQGGAPDLPQRFGADHSLSIAFNAFGAFGENSFVPAPP